MFFPTTVHRILLGCYATIVKGLIFDKRLFQVPNYGDYHDSRIMATIILSVHLVLGIVCNDKLFPRIAVDQLARVQRFVSLTILT